MANVTETPQWEAGVYRIETTDPIIGGENGISNIQAKQLANRTGYLKTRADQVDAAKGAYDSLGGRMTAIEAMAEAIGPEMQNAEVGTVKFLLDQVGQANAGVRYLRRIWQQERSFTFVNRGVVDGCSVSRSTTATRNLNITPGHCFSAGCIWPVGELLNAASVPSNPSGGAISVTAYLYPSGYYNYALAVTAAGESVPDNGIEIFSLQIPAGNTDATDPNLEGVTLIDIRRMEPNFPTLLDNPVLFYVAINPLRDANYRIDFDVRSFSGGHCTRESVQVFSTAPNGFTAQLEADSDNVFVFVRISKLDNQETRHGPCEIDFPGTAGQRLFGVRCACHRFGADRGLRRILRHRRAHRGNPTGRKRNRGGRGNRNLSCHHRHSPAAVRSGRGAGTCPS